MTTAYKKRDEDQELIDEVTALYKRGYRVTGWAVNVGVAALFCAALAALMALLAHFSAPIAALDYFDIPSSVLSHFSNVEPGSASSSGGGFGGIEGQLSTPFSSLSDMLSIFQSPLFFTISLIGLAVCGGLMIFGGHELGGVGMLARMGVAIFMLGASSNILGIITGSSPDSESRQLSPRAEFVDAAEHKRAEVVMQSLPYGNNLDLDYVRAQAALMMIKKEVPGKTELFSRVSKGLAEKPDFTPDEKVAYLVDNAAFNDAKNDIARKYLDERLASAKSKSTWAKTALSLFVVLSLAALGLGLTARSFIKRCHRIDADLVADLEDKKKAANAPPKKATV